jgi:phosphoribosylformylglycinamidine synthase subunit PurSL
VNGLSDGHVPKVDAQLAKKTFAALHRAIISGLVRACHDLSEGGLAAAAAEMAFAGGLGAKIRLAEVPTTMSAAERGENFDEVLLFSESNTRFLVEVSHANRLHFEAALAGIPFAHIGEVTDNCRLQIAHVPNHHKSPSNWLIDLEILTLKEAWQKPLRW